MRVPASRWALDVFHAQYRLGGAPPCRRCGEHSEEQPSRPPPFRSAGVLSPRAWGWLAPPPPTSPTDASASRIEEEALRGTTRFLEELGRVRETGAHVDGHGYIVL